MYNNLNQYFDSRKIPSGETINCDLCIIGGGAAGITVAREFANTGQAVCLLESGGFSSDKDIDELHRLNVEGRFYPQQGSRLRYFGGSTNHWGGHCVPIRRSVFENRDWIPYSGWPFGIDELQPYYERAHKVLEIGPYEYTPQDVAEQLSFKLFPFDPTIIESSLSRYRRQRFGVRFRQDLEEANNVSVLLYATVTSINLDIQKRLVTDIDVKTTAGNSFPVKAKLYILAAGGIENARLLLLSDRDMTRGLGNQHDLVGRFFQEHIWYVSGALLPVDQDLTKVSIYGKELPFEEGYSIRCHLVLPEIRLRELQIPEYRVELQIRHSWDYFPAVRSARRLQKGAKSLDLDRISMRDIFNIISDPMPPLIQFMGDDQPPLIYTFANHVEQVPNPDSRVTLSSEKDALGQNKALLNWKLSNLDKEGIERAQQVFAQEVGRTGIGRMKISIPEKEETILEDAAGVGHHMGTTRMHSDPKQGVVDPNCRIHGIDNIYVSGSSVFPVAGLANPTLTIVALAIRLGEHLKLRFQQL